IAKRFRADSSPAAKPHPERGIRDQRRQRGRDRLRIPRGDQTAARVVDDLRRAADSAGDDRQPRGERFDERDAERFRLDVWLTVKIGGPKDPRDIVALAEKSDAIGDAAAPRARTERLEISRLARTLRSADLPPEPVTMRDVRERIDQ